MTKTDYDNAFVDQQPMQINEKSHLLSNESKQRSSESDSANYDTISSISLSIADDKIYSLWPATFSQSMSLLVGPTMNVEYVDHMTSSPHIVPLQAEEARRTLKKLSKAFLTPGPQKKPSLKMIPSPKQPINHKSILKIHSFDPEQLHHLPLKEARQIEQEKKTSQAQLYRLKVLERSRAAVITMKNQNEQQQHDDSTSGCHQQQEKEADHDEQKEQRSSSSSDNDIIIEYHNDDKKEQKKSTFNQSLFNMVNIFMGSGLLGLPYVFKRAGWIGGSLVTFFFAGMAWRTCILIVRELNGDFRPVHYFFFDDDNIVGEWAGLGQRKRRMIQSFPQLARDAFGTNGSLAFSSILYFELFSDLAIFLVSLGDHLHALFPSLSITRHMIILAMILAIPTILLRTPRLLSYLSFVGICASISIVIFVLLAATVFEGDLCSSTATASSGGGEIIDDIVRDTSAITDEIAADVMMTMSQQLPPVVRSCRKMWSTAGLPIALGLVSYSYGGHTLIPSIYTGMDRPQDCERMISVAFLIIVASCFTVAVSGYYMFGSLVEDQVTISLENFATNNNNNNNNGSSSSVMAIETLTWFMVLTAFSKYTLSMFPLALGFEELLAPFIQSQRMMEMVSSVIKLFLICSSLMVAIFVPSFSFLCSLVGLVTTMIISIIFPAAAHLKLFGSDLSMTDKCLDYFFIICGLGSALLGTYATIGQGI